MTHTNEPPGIPGRFRTATHIFLVPLAVLQTIVVLTSYAFFRQKIAARERASAAGP